MSMLRRPAFLCALALLALFVVPLVADAGPKKEFKAHGFSWALPDDWAFVPPSPPEKSGGIVAKAECDAASVTAYLYVQTSDLDVDSRAKEVKDAGGMGLGRVTRSKIKDTTLSGVRGKVVIKKVKPDGGGEGHFRTYVINTGGKFYQLIVQAWHGSHVSQTEGINGVRKGFRLLKGAGGEDADETFDEVDSGGDSEDGSDDSGDEDGADGEDGDDGGPTWPSRGPKRSGLCVKLPERNMEWTLPEGALKWSGANDNVTDEAARFMWAIGRFKRKKGEFEKNTPDFNQLIMDVVIQKAPPGFKPDAFVQSSDAQNLVQKQWRLLPNPDTGKTRNKDKVKIGNHKGAFVKFEGEHRGNRRVVMLFVCVLKGDVYIFRGICDGYTDAYKHLAPKVGKALKGVRFLDTKELARGPLLIPSVPDFAAKRGEGLGKERGYTLPGIRFEKPEWMAKVQAGGSMERELRWAGEGRTKDGDSYVYFDVSTWQLNISNVANTKPEDVIDKRIEQWKAGAGDEALLSKKGKPPFFRNGKFGKGKGLTYKFTGHLGKTPFTEEGWVVKYKQNLLRFRIQYSGTEAEMKKNKELKAMIKAIKKAVKFKK